MTDCYVCKKPIDVKIQGKIELSYYDEKTKKNGTHTYHYTPNCSGIIKTPDRSG